MAPVIKHGGHKIHLPIQFIASGAGAVEWAYDYLYGNYGVYDSTLEVINRATLVCQGSSGAAGGFLSGDTATLNHYNLAGSLVDAVSITTSGITAHVPVDLTGNTASTGNTFVKGWQMVQGDSVELVVAGTTTAGARNIAVTLLLGTRNV